MSHEINLIASHHILKMRMPSSAQSAAIGLALVSHTLNTGDFVLTGQHQYLIQRCIEKLGVS